VALKYLDYMKTNGYEVVTSDQFKPHQKHAVVIGSNESAIIPGIISFFNFGTEEFDKYASSFHESLTLPIYGKSLLSQQDKAKLQTVTSCKQPIVLNMSYSIQNCLDQETVPGMYLPKLTTKHLQHMTYEGGQPISHHICEMMTCATNFFQNYCHSIGSSPPFQNSCRNHLFGNRIGDIVHHSQPELVMSNCFEGHTGGMKTQYQCGFGSHCDFSNSYSDQSYNDSIVASEAVDVPVNATIPFGSPSHKMFPFAIFFNRRGCETRCEYENHSKQWLLDIERYIGNMPVKLKSISSELFDIDDNLDVTYQVKECKGVKILH
jgi:hypothetical protein